MKRISIQDLKACLSAVVAEAQAGSTIVVTRHDRPVAHLGPALDARTHHGVRVSAGGLRPALRRATTGRYLSVLVEDRGDR